MENREDIASSSTTPPSEHVPHLVMPSSNRYYSTLSDFFANIFRKNRVHPYATLQPYRDYESPISNPSTSTLNELHNEDDISSICNEFKTLYNKEFSNALCDDMCAEFLRICFTKDRRITTVLIFLALLYIASNVIFNWYTRLGNWGDQADSNILLGSNLFSAIGTAGANLIKVSYVCNEFGGCRFDEDRSFLKKLSSTGPQEKIILVLWDRLAQLTYASKEYEYVVALSQDVLTLFPHLKTLTTGLELLQLKFFKLSGGKKVRFIHENEFYSYQESFYTPAAIHEGKKLVMICTFDPPTASRPNNEIYNRSIVIRAYKEGLLGRIINETKSREYAQALITMLKIPPVVVLWLIASGLPGLSVLAAGLVSYFKIFGADKVEDPAQLGTMFFTILTALLFSRAYINDQMKAPAIRLEILRFVERAVHRQPLLHKPKLKIIISVAITSLPTVLLYNAIMALSFTTSGIENTLKQANRFTGAHLSLSGDFATALTCLSILASVFMTGATSSKPACGILAKSSSNKSARQQYPWSFRLIQFFTVIDLGNMVDNSAFATQRALNHFSESQSIIASLNRSPACVTGKWVNAVGNSVFNGFFALEQLDTKFTGCMRLFYGKSHRTSGIDNPDLAAPLLVLPEAESPRAESSETYVFGSGG